MKVLRASIVIINCIMITSCGKMSSLKEKILTQEENDKGEIEDQPESQYPKGYHTFISGDKVSTTYLTHDQNGLVTKKIDKDSKTDKIKCITLNKYNDRKQLISTKYESDCSPHISMTESIFDLNGNLVMEISTYPKRNFVLYKEFIEEGSNKSLRLYQLYYLKPEKKIIHNIQEHYNQKGQLVTHLSLSKNENEKNFSDYYQYDEKGNIIHEEYYSSFKEEKTLNRRIKRNYKEDRLISEETFDEKNVRTNMITYTYDSKYRLTKKIIEDTSNISHEDIFFYD